MEGKVVETVDLRTPNNVAYGKHYIMLYWDLDSNTWSSDERTYSSIKEAKEISIDAKWDETMFHIVEVYIPEA